MSDNSSLKTILSAAVVAGVVTASGIGLFVANQIVSPKDVTDQWLDVTVDLSEYAGKKVQLTIENRANNWRNEWAYWNEIKVVGNR